MASITPQNGRVDFVAAWDPHTYWELNSTNLGTNYGDDTSGNDDNSAVGSGDISTQESYDGMDTQSDPPTNGWMDIYIITDAAMLLYIPAGLAHNTVRGLFHNGGGTNAQGGFLRATTTGVEIAVAHNNGGDLGDYLIDEIPDADLPGWFCVGFQFCSEGGTQGDMGLWINGTKVRNGSRTYSLDYGSGNPDFGNNSGREPNQSQVRDPSDYSGGDWGGNNSINGTGILIANFTCDNPTQAASGDNSPGNGDSFYTDYYDDHVSAGTQDAEVTPATINSVAAVPSATVGGSASITVSTISAVAGVGGVGLAAGAGINASPIDAVAGLPAVSPQGGASLSPSTINTTAGVGSPVLGAGVGISVSSVDTVASVGSVTLAAGAGISPSPVSAVAEIPFPDVEGEDEEEEEGDDDDYESGSRFGINTWRRALGRPR